jgi:hypothetical protein
MVGVLRAISIAAGLALAVPAAAQQSYPTPEAAADALVDGIARHDGDAVGAVLGAGWTRYIPLGDIADDDVTRFLEAWAKAHRIVRAGDAKAYLEVGTHGWTLPIPIEKTAQGWRFDTKGTAEELRTRRIGRNELDVIQVMLALGDAQEDFARINKRYAQKILSTPGRRDGLYWPTADGEAPSPLGPIASDVKPGDAYRGYRYRVLGAPAGGYAFIAWPATWGDTGVMSFIVSNAGVVYQQDLGPDSDRIARAMRTFDPGPGWTRVDTKQ